MRMGIARSLHAWFGSFGLSWGLVSVYRRGAAAAAPISHDRSVGRAGAVEPRRTSSSGFRAEQRTQSDGAAGPVESGRARAALYLHGISHVPSGTSGRRRMGAARGPIQPGPPGAN